LYSRWFDAFLATLPGYRALARENSSKQKTRSICSRFSRAKIQSQNQKNKSFKIKKLAKPSIWAKAQIDGEASQQKTNFPKEDQRD